MENVMFSFAWKHNSKTEAQTFIVLRLLSFQWHRLQQLGHIAWKNIADEFSDNALVISCSRHHILASLLLLFYSFFPGDVQKTNNMFNETASDKN